MTPSEDDGFCDLLSVLSDFLFISAKTFVTFDDDLIDGKITGNYNGIAWSISIVSTGDAEINFSITPSGQIQYTSNDLAGSGYVGEIRFRAKVINQE